MVAIGATVRLASTDGERIVDAASLYRDDGIDWLSKRHDELLVDIHLPPTNGWRASYQKLRRRGAFDFPVLGVAAYVQYEVVSNEALPDGRATDTHMSDKRISDAKIILGGIAPSPIEVTDAANV